MRTKPPVWLRIVCALGAVILFSLSPICFFFAFGFLTHVGPGGHSHYPHTFPEVAVGLAFAVEPVLAIYLAWLAFGASRPQLVLFGTCFIIYAVYFVAMVICALSTA